LKNPLQKNRAGGMAQGEGPEFKHKYRQKNPKSSQLNTAIHKRAIYQDKVGFIPGICFNL
jgi:hypothetical protein